MVVVEPVKAPIILLVHQELLDLVEVFYWCAAAEEMGHTCKVTKGTNVGIFFYPADEVTRNSCF